MGREGTRLSDDHYPPPVSTFMVLDLFSFPLQVNLSMWPLIATVSYGFCTFRGRNEQMT